MALDQSALTDLLDALRSGGDLASCARPCSWCYKPLVARQKDVLALIDLEATERIGPQRPGRGFVGLVAPHPEGMEPIAPLVRWRRVLLVGVGIDQGGVEVQREARRRPARRPTPGHRRRPGRRGAGESTEVTPPPPARRWHARPRGRTAPLVAQYASWDRQSAPTAMATPRWVSTTPGS